MDKSMAVVDTTYSPFAGGLLVFFAVITTLYVFVTWWRSGSWLKWPVSFSIFSFMFVLVFGFVMEYNKFGNINDALGETGNGGLGISVIVIIFHLSIHYLRKGALFLKNRFFSHKRTMEHEKREKVDRRIRLILEFEGEKRDITNLSFERQTEILRNIKDSDSDQDSLQDSQLTTNQSGEITFDLLEQIVAMIIALAIVSVALISYLKNGSWPHELSAPVGVVVGYFFGQRKRHRDTDKKDIQQISEEDLVHIIAQTRKE